jgi:type IV pilus assembly protein PilM
VDNGAILDASKLAGYLTDELERNGLTAVKDVIFTVASSSIPTREAMLPPMKDTRIKAAVETNASEYFPIDISKHRISYGVLKTVFDGEDRGSHMLVMAAPLALIDGYIKLAERAGLDIQAVDYAGNSQFQVIKSLKLNKVVMSVEVGCKHTTVTIVGGDRLLLQRNIALGGSDLVNMYMSASREAGRDYISSLMKCCESVESIEADGVLTADDIEGALARIVSNVVGTINFFKTSRWNAPIDEILLTGTCAHLAGLKDAIASETGVAATSTFDETEYVPHHDGRAAASAMFISGLGSSIAPVDFLPEAFKSGKGKQKQNILESTYVIGIAVFGVCAVIAAVLAMISLTNYQNAVNERNRVQRLIDEYTYAEALYEEYVIYGEAEEGSLVLEDALASNNRQLVAFFEELERKMPSSIILMTASCSESTVMMNFQVPSIETAAKVMVELRTFKSLSAMETSAISESEDEAGFPIYTFAVSCRYGPNPYFPDPIPTQEG